jgi:hypothetical protein
MSTQTPRSLSQLLTNTPDNTAGLITAENLRDIVVSLFPSRGQLELAGTPVATTFVAPNTYVPVAGTTAIDANVCTGCVEMPANGQLRFVKPITQVALFNATLSVLPAANNREYSFTFAVNGVPNDLLHVTQGFGVVQGRPFGVSVSGLVRVQPNDIVSVVVRADGHTTALTASVLTLSGVGFLT